MATDVWKYINESQTGANHIRKNAECQDYTLCNDEENGRSHVILTVADGHGGSKYFRSAQGAVYACEIAMKSALKYCSSLFDTDISGKTNIVREVVESRLKLEIVREWQTKVLWHAGKNPFSDSEKRLLSIIDEDDSSDEKYREKCLAAYGTTLLMVIIAKKVIISMQIGDGDILFYYADDQRTTSPMETDDKLFANETTSLCSLKAPFYFRHNIAFLFDDALKPDLVMLSTDGYSNSFATMEEFYKVAGDYYNILKNTANTDDINISEWLRETSENGSGDDITAAIAWR